MKGCCVECLRFENLSEFGLCRGCESDFIERGMEICGNDEVVEGEVIVGLRVVKIVEKEVYDGFKCGEDERDC